jgi:Matrixin/Putative Ig domain
MLKRRSHILSLVACLLVVAFGEAAFATTAVIPRDDEMVVESRAIVTGRVIGLSTGASASTGFVYTYIRLEVNAVLKGKIGEHEIVLKELGGETSDLGTQICGMPRFELGQEVFLYLNTWPDGALRVHQGFLGKFNIRRDPSTGGAFVERQMEGEDTVIMAGPGAGSGDNKTNRSELDAYEQMVSGLIDTNRKRMRDFEHSYYPDVPVLAQPIEFQTSLSGFDITPQWVLLSPTSPSRWFEADSNQPIVFYVNPAGAPSFLQLQADMQAAMDAWSTAGGSLRVTYGGTTGGCGVQQADGVNTISFNNCDSCFAASEGCSGLLAVSGIVRYFPNQTKNIGGTLYGKAVEANMSFNPYALCNFTNRCQVQEVATHEMGHAIGLGHSSDSSSTMYAYAHFDNRCASLTPDDVQGVTSIYPGGSGAGRLSITTTDLPTATVDQDYSANLEASGGTGTYHWDLVSGQIPPGLQLGASGFLFGKTSVFGTFTFAAHVRDASANTSQSSFTIVVNRAALGPAIIGAEFRKKKTFVSGNGFQANAMVYVDGQALTASLDGTTLTTEKRKLKPGVHQVYVVNPDGKRSNTFQFEV